MGPNAIEWDVFISHNRHQKSWVRQVVDQWRSVGLRVFFDEDSIQPGEDIVTGIENGIVKSRHVVLVITPSAVASRWVAMEVATTIFTDPDAQDGRLIPVVLEPTYNIRPVIKKLNMIDLTDAETREDRYQLLLASLLNARTPLPSLPDWDATETARIELKIEADLDSFTDEQQRILLRGVKELLGISGEIKLIDKRKGSVILRLELSPDDAERIRAAAEAGQLTQFGVVEAKLVHDGTGVQRMGMPRWIQPFQTFLPLRLLIPALLVVFLLGLTYAVYSVLAEDWPVSIQKQYEPEMKYGNVSKRPIEASGGLITIKSTANLTGMIPALREQLRRAPPKRALFVLEDDFWNDDYFKVRPHFEEVGFQIEVAAPARGAVTPADAGTIVIADVAVDQVDASRFQVIIFSGRGDSYREGAPYRRAAERLIQLVLAQGGCVVGVGKGVLVLTDTPPRGRRRSD